MYSVFLAHIVLTFPFCCLEFEGAVELLEVKTMFSFVLTTGNILISHDQEEHSSLFFFHFSSNAHHPATNLTLKYVKHHNWGLHDWVFFCQNCITSKPALLLNLLVYIRSHGNIHHILRRKPELCSSNACRSFFFLVYGYITKSRDALYMMYPEAGHSVCLGK